MSSAFAFGKSNYLSTALADRFRVYAKQRVWLAGPGKLATLSARCVIIVSLFEVLSVVTLRIYLSVSICHFRTFRSIYLTLSLIPKLSRTSTKAIARFMPEWDFGISTMSSNIANGLPSCSRWTVMATNTLWLGEVHTSVAKLSLPSYSCIQVSNNRSYLNADLPVTF